MIVALAGRRGQMRRAHPPLSAAPPAALGQATALPIPTRTWPPKRLPQIHSMISKLAQFTDISAALVVGGLSLQAQVRRCLQSFLFLWIR